jgi:hypothetical protein
MNKPDFHGPQKAVTTGLPQTTFDATPLIDGLDAGDDGFQFNFGNPDSDGPNGQKFVSDTPDALSGGNDDGHADSGPERGSDKMNGVWSDLFAGAARASKNKNLDSREAAPDTTATDGEIIAGAGAISTVPTSTATSTPTSTSSDPNTWVSGSDTPDGYNISITFMGTWSEDIKQVVKDTLELISDYVTGDLPDVGDVDDIHIVAQMADLGSFLGYGGSSALRTDSYLPSSGYFFLDNDGAASALNNGNLDDLVFHEVLHCMGFGLTWDYLGLVTDYGGDLRFSGENATEAYASTYKKKFNLDDLSDLGVPVETDGGTATAGKHWDDSTFGREIMTGRLNNTNKITDMTIAALEDMGYETTYGDDLLVA